MAAPCPLRQLVGHGFSRPARVTETSTGEKSSHSWTPAASRPPMPGTAGSGLERLAISPTASVLSVVPHHGCGAFDRLVALDVSHEHGAEPSRAVGPDEI